MSGRASSGSEHTGRPCTPLLLCDADYARFSCHCPHSYGTTIWSPLYYGVLTGKYNDGIPAGSRFDRETKFFSSHAEALNKPEGKAMIEKVKALTKIAEGKLNCKMATLAIAWTALNPNVSTCILGASSVEQLQMNLAALEVLPKLQSPEGAAIVKEIEDILDNKPAAPAVKRPLN